MMRTCDLQSATIMLHMRNLGFVNKKEYYKDSNLFVEEAKKFLEKHPFSTTKEIKWHEIYSFFNPPPCDPNIMY